ncbi:hypothetical protein MKZ38_006718 [Zalerion maritima]|uniref:Casein kinase substrate phosphoprotein PP28 domain-containing protein n=1 Tax=Zalerion maritima TaxID=339359 RepID=A0AAD5WPM6_9PEZI|nr:hypothetical protein MKZ38_006718 [Zalerion maritima]
MPARPGGNSRGRGGKFNKAKRGGGHKFSSIQVFNADGDAVSPWSEDAILPDNDNESSDASGSGSSSDADSESEAGPSTSTYIQEEHPGPQLGMTREEARAAKKAKKDAAKKRMAARAVEVGDLPSSESEDEGLSSGSIPAKQPLHKDATPQKSILKKPTTTQTSSGGDTSSSDVDSGDSASKLAKNMKKVALSKKAIEGQQAKDKLTEEERTNLERLAKIREERAQKQLYSQAEKEEVEDKNQARKDKTAALLKKAQENKASKGKKKKGKK